MNRRESIKYIIVASGGLIALPSWADSFTPTEQELLASVADTIIPVGNGFGALSVGTDKYLGKLIDNCFEADVQANIKKQLAALNTNAQASHQKNFHQCSQKEREALLLRFDASTDKSEKDFFTLVKSETIRGFSTSKEVMQQLKYKIAPGHYYGCVDVKA